MITEKLHEIVWNRYIRMPYGHLLDYAEVNGNVEIPTKEECEKKLPNAMGFITPIADCAFFGGLYVYGLCEKYDICPSDKLKEQINLMIDGLLLLCDVSKVDGFIARGVADDGITHYPTTTIDQVGPWIIGLWRVLNSKINDQQIERKIKERLCRTINGLIKNNWQIPLEWENENLGDLKQKDWREICQVLLIAKVAENLGLITSEEYNEMLLGTPEGSIYNRLEIASNGYSADMIKNTALIQFWITIPAQLALRELANLDKENANLYLTGLKKNGADAVAFFDDYIDYNKDNLSYNYNWRELIPEIRPYTTFKEAFNEAYRLNGLWSAKYGELKKIERLTIAQSIFACWIAVVSTDKKAMDFAYKTLIDMANTVDFDKMGQSFVFAIESALYSYEKINKKN